MIKKFKISANSKYYVSEDIAKDAIGHSSLSSYILSLKAENQLARQDLEEKIDKLSSLTQGVLEISRGIKAGIDPITIEEAIQNIAVGIERVGRLVLNDGTITDPQISSMAEDLRRISEAINKIKKTLSFGK